ncbi:hypothetical protein ACTMTI_38305 [Nonomuraea sp. H19]|uniref:hypothetical protein n=1 Tax=Nonomuraea sp. H19 TaxID=3452206 RepID=UPI003F8BDFE4
MSRGISRVVGDGKDFLGGQRIPAVRMIFRRCDNHPGDRAVFHYQRGAAHTRANVATVAVTFPTA